MLPKPPKLSPRSPSWRYHGPSWSQLAANLTPTSPILCPSSRQPAQKFLENRAQHPKRCPKIAQDCSKTRFSSHRPLQAPQNTQKPVFSLGFCTFSAIQPMCQNSPKMFPPKTSQVEPRIANLALSWPILVACCQLGPNFAYPAPIFAPTCTETFR